MKTIETEKKTQIVKAASKERCTGEGVNKWGAEEESNHDQKRGKRIK